MYVESSVVTATPLELVAMLYRCAIDALAEARRCLSAGDVTGRVAPVNRAFDAVAELSLSLDFERGGDISRNLSELYGYISHKIILGHANQSDECFAEAGRLLSTLLDGWREVAAGAAVGSY
jgi:flagellar protein FliS